MNGDVRKEKLATMKFMIEHYYSEEKIKDYLELDNETYLSLLNELKGQNDPYFKLREAFKEVVTKNEDLFNKPVPPDIEGAIVHALALKGVYLGADIFLDEKIENEIKPKIIEMHRENPEVFTIENLSILHQIAEWKIQEWLEE